MYRLRHRPHPAAGWVTLAVLYSVATVLNVLLGLGTGRCWPLIVAAVFGGVSGVCVVVALRKARAVARGHR